MDPFVRSSNTGTLDAASFMFYAVDVSLAPGRPEQSGFVSSAPSSGTRVSARGLGGILVIVGIALMIVWSFWLGLIVTLVGLIAFGGFAKGKWY